MQYYDISSGSTWFIKVKTIFRQKYFLKNINNNLTPLDIYNVLSQDYCIKPEGKYISIQRVKVLKQPVLFLVSSVLTSTEKTFITTPQQLPNSTKYNYEDIQLVVYVIQNTSNDHFCGQCKIVSEYDLSMSQTHNADQPTAP